MRRNREIWPFSFDCLWLLKKAHPSRNNQKSQQETGVEKTSFRVSRCILSLCFIANSARQSSKSVSQAHPSNIYQIAYAKTSSTRRTDEVQSAWISSLVVRIPNFSMVFFDWKGTISRRILPAEEPQQYSWKLAASEGVLGSILRVFQLQERKQKPLFEAAMDQSRTFSQRNSLSKTTLRRPTLCFVPSVAYDQAE